MKNKTFIILLSLVSILALTSCDLSLSFFDWFNSINGGNNTELSTYEEGLLVYDNPNKLNDNKAGELDEEYPNVDTINLNTTYLDYSSNSFYNNIDSMPSIGDVNLLIIPVKLKDYNGNVNEKTRYDIYNAYFGTENDTGWRSVASYFYESSYGNLKISGTVSDWYAPNVASTDVVDSNSTNKLVKNATEWYKNKYNSSLSEFDSDKDGYIDNVCLIYNAPARYKNNENLWAYTYWIQDGKKGTPSEPIPNTYFWASCSFMYESNRLDIDAHTYIHELGHVMGLDDYYNYDPNSRYGASGGFLMQDYNVGDHDPYSKIALGWVKPSVVTGTTTIKLRPFATSGQVLIFKPSGKMNSPFDEYLMMDFYTPDGLNKEDSYHVYKYGYPKGPTDYGLRIWHVDARLIENFNPESTKVTLTNEIIKGNRYLFAMSNSTDEDYGSVIPSFRNYKLLHLLQQSNVNTFKKGDFFSLNDLWKKDDTFSMSQYSDFFVNKGQFNTGSNLNFAIKVNEVNKDYLTLEVTM